MCIDIPVRKNDLKRKNILAKKKQVGHFFIPVGLIVLGSIWLSNNKDWWNNVDFDAFCYTCDTESKNLKSLKTILFKMNELTISELKRMLGYCWTLTI